MNITAAAEIVAGLINSPDCGKYGIIVLILIKLFQEYLDIEITGHDRGYVSGLDGEI
jgi:hypothetical protein